MAVRQMTEEQLWNAYEAAGRVMGKATRAGLRELQISGYDKLSVANSPVLAAYINNYVRCFLAIVED